CRKLRTERPAEWPERHNKGRVGRNLNLQVRFGGAERHASMGDVEELNVGRGRCLRVLNDAVIESAGTGLDTRHGTAEILNRTADRRFAQPARGRRSLRNEEVLVDVQLQAARLASR